MTLKNGIEYAGKFHKEFELRPALVSDTIAIYDDPDTAERCSKNRYYAEFAIIARCITKLGDIPIDHITVNMLLQMTDTDGGLLIRAARGLLPTNTK